MCNMKMVLKKKGNIAVKVIGNNQDLYLANSAARGSGQRGKLWSEVEPQEL